MEESNWQNKRTLDLIIPTYKPDQTFDELLRRINEQTIRPNRIIVMNTQEEYMDESKYNYLDNLEVIHIKKEEFDHGGTRNFAVGISNADYVFLMTQDAIPADRHLIEKILKGFEHQGVAAVYGRQLPRKNASVIESYTRSFNYPDEDMVKGKEDVERLGIKTYFCSNVCAAYNREIYEKLGGFVTKTIFNEDMIMSYHLIQAGYKIAYASQAKVIHSHHYTYRQQFTRNFDLAVSQKQYAYIFDSVKSETEGIKLVKQSIRYLLNQRKAYLILDLILQSGFKFLGYRCGKNYDKLPKSLVKKLSMNKSYWG